MNTEVDPEQMNKTHWTSQTNEQYACSVFVCSLPTLGRTLSHRVGADFSSAHEHCGVHLPCVVPRAGIVLTDVQTFRLLRLNRAKHPRQLAHPLGAGGCGLAAGLGKFLLVRFASRTSQMPSSQERARRSYWESVMATEITWNMFAHCATMHRDANATCCTGICGRKPLLLCWNSGS